MTIDDRPDGTDRADTVPIRITREPADAAAGLVRITLNRPDRGNSLSAEMVETLAAALGDCAADGTRVVLIDAAGANFCTGFDLSDLDRETDDSLLARFVRVELLLQQLHRAPFLTVAVAHGRAWGAGADLFAACGQRWVRDGTTFTFPGAAFGLLLGTARLAARVGAARAEAWVASGARIDVAAALVAGLATERLGSNAAEDAPAAARALAEASGRLDAVTLAAVRSAAEPRDATDDAVDLARLVRSAARRGLRARIQTYRAATAKR